METWKKADGFATVREKVNGNFAAVDTALAEAGAKLEQAKAALTGQIGQTETALESALASARTALEGQIAVVQSLAEGRARLVVGTYTGSGAASRTISLGFTPKAVLVARDDGTIVNSNSLHYGGLAVTGGASMTTASKRADVIAISTGGFAVYYNGSSAGSAIANGSNSTYYYVALV